MTAYLPFKLSEGGQEIVQLAKVFIFLKFCFSFKSEEDAINWRVFRKERCSQVAIDLFRKKAIMICAPKGSGKTQFAFDMLRYLKENNEKILKENGFSGLKCIYHAVDSDVKKSNHLANDIEAFLNNGDDSKLVLMLDETQ